MGATILDPKASSTAGEPIEASEAGELVGTEQVESAVSCVVAPSVAGDTAEARAAVKPRIETSVAGELAEARAAGEPAEVCPAGAADTANAASKLTGASATASSEQAEDVLLNAAESGKQAEGP